MLFYKLFILLIVVGLVSQTICLGAATVTPNDKRGEQLSPELKRNALELLSKVSLEIGQFKLAENRLRARIITADLMWEHDEAAARRVYQYAFKELRNLFGQIDKASGEKMSGDRETEHDLSRFRLVALRREYVLTLAKRDPALAVEALGALKTKKIEEWEPLVERLPLLKFETATAIAAKDSNRAFAIYKEEIAANGITPPLGESFNGLHRKNSELTAKIFKEVFAIVKTAKISGFSPALNGTKTDAANSKQTELEFWQVTAFLNAASKLKRRAEREKTGVPPLAEAEIKELAKLLARAFLNTHNPEKNAINQAMTAITLYAPDQVRAIEQKVGAEGVLSYQTVMKSDEHYLWLEEKNADELAREAERSTNDSDYRDLLYAEAARKALDANDAEKAQVFAARIKKRDNYKMLFQEIETAAPLAVARRGNEAEFRQLPARLKTKEKRLAVLLEFAAAVAARGEREAAKKLLDETERVMVTAPPPGEPDAGETLESRMEIASKFAAVLIVVKPDEAFAGIETIIEAVNARIKRRKPSVDDSVAVKEMLYEAMERRLLLHAPETVEMLKNLARSDFERTVKLLDKFEDTEIRLFARLRLVQSLLDAAAAEKEKEARQRVLDEVSET